MNRAKLPAASYPAKYRELLIAGTLRRVEIPCADWAQATKFRHQISQYRKRAKEEKIPDVDMLYRAVLRVDAKGTPRAHILVIEPRGAEFGDAIGKLTEGASAPASVASPAPGILDEFDPS